MSNIKIGCVGFGFVGKAVSMGFLQVGGFDVFVSDPFVNVGDVVIFNHHFDSRDDVKDKVSTLTQTKLYDMVVDTRIKIIFVCVPTPMFENGSSDISIVEQVCRDINNFALVANRKDLIVCIKSTVPPGTTKKLNQECKNVTVAFNPEFLREATFLQDFIEQNRIVIGCEDDLARNTIRSLYWEFIQNRNKKLNKKIIAVLAGTIITFDDPTEAEMVKYVANCYMATKISFANEMYQICEKLNINYDNVIMTATKDKRLGPAYGWKVPGPIKVEGEEAFGFGLSCFSKDINALISTAKELGIDPKMLKATWEKNLEVRPPKHRDWEKMSKAYRKKEK